MGEYRGRIRLGDCPRLGRVVFARRLGGRNVPADTVWEPVGGFVGGYRGGIPWGDTVGDIVGGRRGKRLGYTLRGR